MGNIQNLVERIRKNYKKDGVWSWFICVCAFFANAMTIGIDSSFGEPMGSIMRAFNSSEPNVARIGSVYTSSAFFSASLSAILAERFGFASVIAIGIMISSAFFSISTTSHNVPTLIIEYGLFAGFGNGLIYAPANIMCSYYFIKRRFLATGIAVCGGEAGIVVVSMSMNFIDASYGWKGCVIFCACICPLCVPLAIIAYILPENCEERTIEETKNNALDELVEIYRYARLNLLRLKYKNLVCRNIEI